MELQKIESWVVEAIQQFGETNLTQDIHIDEFFESKYNMFSKAEIFSSCCQVFSLLINYINNSKLDISDANIILSIDLEGGSNQFSGKPKSIHETKELIDIYSIPEIIIYRDLQPNSIPMTELYRVPILYNHFGENLDINIFYKEYRTFEEIMADGEYQRELFFSFIK